MNVKIPSIFDNSPRHSGILPFGLIQKLGNQFAYLNDAHTADILKEMVVFKCGKVVLVTLQMIRNSLAVHDNFLKNNRVTRFDRATPLLSESFPKSRDRKPLL